MNTIEAMKQALRALIKVTSAVSSEHVGLLVEEPIADLRAAIAELENAEPVAYVCGTYAGRFIVGPVNGVTVLPDGMALYAAPPAPAIPAGWQPIETAPKDCRILIGRVGHPWVFSAWWNDRHEHWATGPSPMDFFAEPTHWMPLPKAPNGEASSAEGVTMKDLIDAEMAEYSDGAYADHGSARDSLERFASRVKADALEAQAKEIEALRVSNEKLIEDRARFPDKPDDIGRMISARIGNLKAAAKQYEESWRAAQLRADVLQADAERYRWLREQHWSTSAMAVITNPIDNARLGTFCPSEKLLDDAIDAARMK